MILENLKHGDRCEMLVNYDGNSFGSIVTFSHMSKDRNEKPAGIFSPEGEPDMQSMMMLYAEEVKPALNIGQRVYHVDIYDGHECMEVVGLRSGQVKLRGDYSGGTHNVSQTSWMSIDGIMFNKNK